MSTRFSGKILTALIVFYSLSATSPANKPSVDDDNQLGNKIDNGMDISNELRDENDSDEFCAWDRCAKKLSELTGVHRIVDFGFLKKFVRNLNPFSSPRMIMSFYLFKRSFPDCGQQLDFNDPFSVYRSGFNVSHPTRILIHGWMSQSRGSFNRDVKNAYLNHSDYNVIVTDWSGSAVNPNYFSVAKMIEEFGDQLARFTTQLHSVAGVAYDDIYLIGHSLGAQIAGAAGKRIRPNLYNTIYALDPAGPKFRHRSIEFRIDPSDAKYVESIQTSANLGFMEPTGTATFYPNFGVYQKKCYYVGCSHIRAYKMFAESINSPLGFWGSPCERDGRYWNCNEARGHLEQMGGEPSIPKTGLFYVKTASSKPFALGRNLKILQGKKERWKERVRNREHE